MILKLINSVPAIDDVRCDPITNAQAEMMLHAIGADHKDYRRYKGKRIYHACRNYYDAGGMDIELWDDLRGKGYAEKKGYFYHVTKMGLCLLELMTESTIYDNYQTVVDCKRDVLETFMREEMYGGWLPTSAKSIAKKLKMPVELARATARELLDEGYIQRGHYGDIDDEGLPYCVHGYYLTDKARKLERYKELECYHQKVYLNWLMRNKV